MLPPLMLAAALAQRRPTIVNPTGDNNIKNVAAVCYANLRISSDGKEYWNSAASLDNYSTEHATWLTKGSASAVWIERTNLTGDPGTLNNADPGTGRLQCNVNRDFSVTEITVTEIHACSFDLTFYDAASGGRVLKVVNYTLSANRTTP